MHFMAVKKSRKLSGFVRYSYFKDSTFTAVERDVSKLLMWKGYLLSIEGTGKGHLFCQKWCIKGKGVGPWGGASPYKTFLSIPPGFVRPPALALLACVASVSNRVIARKVERKQKIFFCSCPSFLDEPREETLATQAIALRNCFEG